MESREQGSMYREYLASGLVFVVVHKKLQHTRRGVVHLHLIWSEKWEAEEADCLRADDDADFLCVSPFCAHLPS